MHLNSLFGNFVFCALMFLPSAAWAAHPLITDDTGTQGKGKFQFELNGQYDYDKETLDGVSVKTTGGQAATTLTYGIIDNLDLAIGVPYLWITEKDDGVLVSDVKGVSDATLDVKWRFFEKEGLSFALRPGLSFPTGDENKGLGTGKTGYHLYLIGTKESEPWAFHANLGYIRNENKFEEQKNLWHASVAATYAIGKNLRLTADTGVERNSDTSSHAEPAYFLGGVIYSITENLDVDFGVKHALSSSETDVSVMAGSTFRF